MGLIVVSFATRGYLLDAAALAQSLEHHGVDYRISLQPAAADWVQTCARKPAHLWREYRTHSGPVCWLDADSRLCAAPDLLTGDDMRGHDVAFHRFGAESCSGTVWANRTPRGEAFLAHWQHLCVSDPTTWDQRQLDRAAELSGAKVYELPPEYCWIDTHSERRYPEAGPPVVYHYQASRRNSP